MPSLVAANAAHTRVLERAHIVDRIVRHHAPAAPSPVAPRLVNVDADDVTDVRPTSDKSGARAVADDDAWSSADVELLERGKIEVWRLRCVTIV
jgi:hypothetical protein